MAEEIESQDGLLIGISADSVESHKRFKESLGIPFNLLSDRNKHIMALYKVTRWPKFLPNKRATYVVSKNGAVAGVFHHELAFSQHVTDVVGVLKELQPDH